MADSVYTVKASTLADGASIGGGLARSFVRKSNGDLAVCYKRSDGTYHQIYVAESTDNGVNWTETALTTYGASKGYPTLCVDDHDRLYCFYGGKDSVGGQVGDTQVRMKPAGSSWGNAIVIGSYASVYSGGGNGVCGANGRIWCLIWFAGYSCVVYSDDHGANWSARTDMSAATSWNIAGMGVIHINPSDGYPGVIYLKALVANYIWRYRKWNGTIWSDEAYISDSAVSSDAADFIFDSTGSIHFVVATGSRIKYRHTGGSFVQLCSNHASFWPKLFQDINGDLYCFWYGYTAADASNRHLQYRKSTDNGANWEAQVTLTSGSYQNRYPQAIHSEYPRPGGIFSNKYNTGYAIFYVVDADLKVRVSSDLTWATASAIVKEYSESGAGTDLAKADKWLIIPESGAGTDRYVKYFEIPAFTDSGAGTDETLAYIPKVITDTGAGSDLFNRNKIGKYVESGSGSDVLKSNKKLIIVDTGSGIDLLLRNKKNNAFNDDGYGTDRYNAQYPYPKDLKRILILVRDRK